MIPSLHPRLGGVEQAPSEGGNDVLTKFGAFKNATTQSSRSSQQQKISENEEGMTHLTTSTAAVSPSASASTSSSSSLEFLESPGDISLLNLSPPFPTTVSIAAVIATCTSTARTYLEEEKEEEKREAEEERVQLQLHLQSHTLSLPQSQSTSQPESQQASRQSHPRGTRTRTTSRDLVPTQTILKALASTASASVPESLPREIMCPRGGAASSSAAASPQQLAEALQDLAKKRTAPASAIANMLSPCFYHQRFDDAVDIDRVLEEIKNDGFMSHSRLVQTAISVREVSKQLQRRPIKRAVRNVMIVTKARDNHLVYLTRELASWLLQTPRYGSDIGVNVYVDAKLRTSKRFDATRLVAQDPRFQDMLKYWTPDLCWSQPEKFDLVITLGGDGTVLFTSWLFQRIVPPVLSFSLGSLGFMTTFEFEHYKKHLNRVMGDDGMKINLRMRFTCTVWRQDSGRSEGLKGDPMDEGEQFEVLNELVIDRGPSPYVSNLELYGDDELLTVVQADGCIFSTPTGSTAYSLSAGGSLVHPDIPAILLTPICPHTLSFRPMVLSDTMALRVVVPRNSRATAYCAFDGKGRIELRQGDHVTITASQYPFPTVTRTDTEWFDSVSRTLRWNVRAAAQKPFDASGLSSEAGDDDEGGDASWDIDTDSACYTTSEEGSVAASPVRRQMSMLGL